MTTERAITIAYNAICEGQIEERMNHKSVLIELGITEEEYQEIMSEDAAGYEEDEEDYYD